MGSFKLKEKFPKIKDAGDYERGHIVEGTCRLLQVCIDNGAHN